MRSRFVVGVVAFLMFVGNACSSDSSPSKTTVGVEASTTVAATIPTADLASKASRVTDLLISNKWAEATATFATPLASRFDAVALKTAWDSMTASFGPYKSRGATVAVSDTFETPMVFGITAMKSQITFDADGKVSDLLIVKA